MVLSLEQVSSMRNQLVLVPLYMCLLARLIREQAQKLESDLVPDIARNLPSRIWLLHKTTSVRMYLIQEM